ncbi:MAG: metallophosphoesterase family protein [Spirochaetaceae bacterium]|nr:MAG: metallophosphoesterase family protein [Spirochaetaceae bacterium]
MRIAVLSDVHANREALLEVERALRDLAVERILYLGDAVGYNADPEHCTCRLAELTELAVRGNHDKTVANPTNLDWFNEVARSAILWTRQALSPGSLQILDSLPKGPRVVLDRYLLCHGSPMDEDLYITRRTDVDRSFTYLKSRLEGIRICFYGHTHIPYIIEEDGRALTPPERFHLDPERFYMINPGSVGQPRDRIPLASFGVLDEEDMVYYHYRVPFPVETAQRKIIAAGLPRMLADRLAAGW